MFLLILLFFKKWIVKIPLIRTQTAVRFAKGNKYIIQKFIVKKKKVTYKYNNCRLE